jgi:hypothetical protein
VYVCGKSQWYQTGEFSPCSLLPKKVKGQVWWFMPVIPETLEVEIRRIMAQGQLGKELPRLHLNQQASSIIPASQEA